MEEILNKLDEIKLQALNEIEKVNSKELLEEFKIKFLSRKGLLRQVSLKFEELNPEQKSRVGRLFNEIKAEIVNMFNSLEKRLTKSASEEDIEYDLTLPGVKINTGTFHPVVETMNRIVESFEKLGFTIAWGPELESEYNNYEALNIPSDHPARDALDVYYVEGGELLRSHTSPVQIRTMKNKELPMRIIAPGKVFRPDVVDASHSQIFHQVEGFAVDEDISFADLKGCLNIFVKEFFGEKIETRFRPSYFPFTEPSAEVDITCIFCSGKGCNVCKYGGWLEILGSGMIHPKVLENCNIDSEKYTGFAFGMGVERIAMLKYQIPDIRFFLQNNLSFLQQFTF